MKKCAAVLLIMMAFTAVITSCFAEVLMPQRGNKIKKSGSLTIDCSNCSEGYVMVKAKPTKNKLRLRVVHDKMDIHYDLNSDGEYEVIPLQDGNGKYVFTLYIQVKSIEYEKLNTISMTVNMPDPDRCFLYPNQYINYTPDTPAVIRAREVCEGLTDPVAKAHAIYRDIFVEEALEDAEDLGHPQPQTETTFVEAVKFKYRQIDPYQYPNIDKAFETRTGSCKDQSGLYVAMLRSVGVPAMYAVTDGEPGHAWVVFIIDGKKYEIDPILQVPFCLIPADVNMDCVTRIY